MSQRKIDTHHHFLPKLYIDAVGLDLLNAAMPGGVAPTWSEEAAIAMMFGRIIRDTSLIAASR